MIGFSATLAGAVISGSQSHQDSGAHFTKHLQPKIFLSAIQYLVCTLYQNMTHSNTKLASLLWKVNPLNIDQMVCFSP